MGISLSSPLPPLLSPLKSQNNCQCRRAASPPPTCLLFLRYQRHLSIPSPDIVPSILAGGGVRTIGARRESGATCAVRGCPVRELLQTTDQRRILGRLLIPQLSCNSRHGVSRKTQTQQYSDCWCRKQPKFTYSNHMRWWLREFRRPGSSPMLFSKADYTVGLWKKIR